MTLKERCQLLSSSFNCLIRSRSASVVSKPEQWRGSPRFSIPTMESSLGCVIWSKPEDAGDWRRAPFPFRYTVKYDAFSSLQSNHQVLLRKMLQRCFNLEQEWVIVYTTQWCCQPASALPHSFCFLGMIISCWHYECVFWGEKKNVGTCYFWNEDVMCPSEVSYPLRGQVLANMWSPNPEHQFPHVMFYHGTWFPVILTGLCWVTQKENCSEAAAVLQLPQTWKLSSGGFQPQDTLESPWELLWKYHCWGPPLSKLERISGTGVSQGMGVLSKLLKVLLKESQGWEPLISSMKTLPNETEIQRGWWVVLRPIT